DPRTFERAGGAGAALEDSRASAGAGQPEPARIPATRADESDSKGAWRTGRQRRGNRRTAQKGRRSRHDRGSEERVRARVEAAGQDDPGLGGIHGVAHLPGMDDVAAVVEVLRD